VLTGQVRLSGAMLANPAGQAGDILVAAGQVVITGEVTTMGFRQVLIAGTPHAIAKLPNSSTGK
jgi:adhesin HecA-like repeat protein